MIHNNQCLSSPNHYIKPHKKVTLKFSFIVNDDYDDEEEDEQEFPLPEDYERAKRYQIKNPKWASLKYKVRPKDNFEVLRHFKKFKSLQLRSIVFEERQERATVGLFNGDIYCLQKVSKHLKKLHFSAGVVGKRRFSQVKKWILRRKRLTDLLLVPYWFPTENQSQVRDWDEYECRTDGVPHLIRQIHSQLEKLGILGYAREDLLNNLNFNRMKRLRHFTIRAAHQPENGIGQPDEFGDLHLEFMKKALMAEQVNILTLYCEYHYTTHEFWTDLKDMILKYRKSLVVDVKFDYEEPWLKKNIWFKEIFKNLPGNIKVNYSIKHPSYFLSMPQGIEVSRKLYGNDDSDDESDN